MPTTWAIKLEAVATTKRNATHNVEAGWSLLIAKLCPAMGGGQAADILFFEEKDDTLEAARLISGSPTTPSAQALLAAALAKAIDVEAGSPRTVRMLQQLTSESRSLCESTEEEEGDQGDQHAHLIGKEVSLLSLPVYDNDSNIVASYDGVATITEYTGGGIYQVTFTYEERLRKIGLLGSILEVALARAASAVFRCVAGAERGGVEQPINQHAWLPHHYRWSRRLH